MKICDANDIVEEHLYTVIYQLGCVSFPLWLHVFLTEKHSCLWKSLGTFRGWSGHVGNCSALPLQFGRIQAGLMDAVASYDVGEGFTSRSLLLVFLLPTHALLLPFSVAKSYLFLKLQFRDHQLKSFIQAFGKYSLNACVCARHSSRHWGKKSDNK